MKVTLLLWGDSAQSSPQVEWSLGDQVRAQYEPSEAHTAVVSILEGNSEYILFWDSALPLPSAALVQHLTESADVVHAGLRVGTQGLPEQFDWLLAQWSLLDPPETVRSNSWRVSLRCCLASVEVLRGLGHVDPAFDSLDAAALDAGLRWLRRGAIVWYDPELLSERAAGPPSLSPEDCYLLALRAFSEFWIAYLLLYGVLTTLRPIHERRALAAARKRPGCPFARARWEGGGGPALHAADPPRISVILPTLGRYPYLPDALDSLRKQTIRPAEVVCVDQNAPSDRRPEVYEAFADLNLQVIWQDERGQSLARNTALAATTGDYVFMFDDDSIAAPDAIEQHLRAITRYAADVSTGVSFPPPPTDYELPEGYRHLRIADTLDTGNCLITRRALRIVGGLDRAYDHGVNTDIDLATRLYLAGVLIIHNPYASRVHYKAPTGGLRTYGSWWATSAQGLLRPFPAPTQLYYMFRYLSPRQRRARIWLYTLIALRGSKSGAAYRKSRAWESALHAAGLLALLPIRLTRALRAARQLLREGPRIPTPDAEAAKQALSQNL